MKKTIVGAVMAVLLVASAFAFMGDGIGRRALADGDYDAWVAAHDLSEERFDELRAGMQDRAAHHEAVEAALEAGDYDAFVAAMEDRPRAEVTEEQFGLMAEMHAAMEAGDTETAAEIRDQMAELGYGPGFGGHGKGRGGMGGGFGGCPMAG